MILLVYTITAVSLLALTHRFVRPLSLTCHALLFLLPFCLTGEALLRDRVYGPIDLPYATEPLLPMRGQYGIRSNFNGMQSDVATQMIPWRQAVRWAYSHHEWPLWNPFILNGDILAAAAQPAPYSPFTLLALLLPVAKSFTYTAAITFFIAALCAFLFACELGCRESSALIAAAGFMCSAGLTFFVEWPLGFSWTFLPFVLLGVRRVIRSPSVRSASVLATAFTLLLLAGHPETAAHVVCVGGIYALFEMARVRRRLHHAAIAGVAAGVIAMALCAVFILPILEAAKQTSDAIYRKMIFANQPAGVETPQVLARLATDVFPFLHARRWHVAGIPNTPIETAAVGSIVLAFAVFAMWRVRSPDTWFFGASAIVFLLARADWGPVVNTMKKLPLLDITLNERLCFAAAFALALLAALGVEQVLREASTRPAAVTITIVLLALAAGTVALLHAGVVMLNNERWGDYKIFCEIAGLCIVAALLVARLPHRWLAAAILGALLLQRAVSDRGIYLSFPAAAAYPPVAEFEPLKKIQGPFRVTGVFVTMIAGTGAMYGLEDPRGYEAMTLDRSASAYPLWCEAVPVWFNRVNDLSKPFLSFLNVRFAVVWPKYPLPEGWRDFSAQRGTKVIENTKVIERAFVPSRVRLGYTQGEMLGEMSAAKDFRDMAWIETTTGRHERTNGPGRVSIRRRGSTYKLTADMENDGWIVVSDSAWAGWRAYIDDRRVQMQNANIAYLSVFVPRGHHRVTLRYLPRSFVIGRVISLTTLLVIVGFASAARFRKRRIG